MSTPERPLFVVGTDTGIGKTVVSAAVVRALDARYWKPVQTGADDDTAEVAALAGPCADGTERAVAPPLHHFALPASPHTAAAVEGASVDPDRLGAALSAYSETAAPRRLVCELAGGLLVPLTDTYTQADWLAAEQPDAVLVARTALGTLNHTLLTLEALERRGLTPRALVVVGEAHAANERTLLPHVRALHHLPQLEPLDTERLDRWLSSTDLADSLR